MFLTNVDDTFIRRNDLKQKENKIKRKDYLLKLKDLNKFVEDIKLKAQKENLKLNKFKKKTTNKAEAGDKSLLFKQIEKQLSKEVVTEKKIEKKEGEIQKVLGKLKTLTKESKLRENIKNQALSIKSERVSTQENSEINLLGAIKKHSEVDTESADVSSSEIATEVSSFLEQDKNIIQEKNIATEQKAVEVLSSFDSFSKNGNASNQDLNNFNRQRDLSENQEKQLEKVKEEFSNVASWKDKEEEGIEFRYESKDGQEYVLRLITNSEKVLSIDVDSQSSFLKSEKERSRLTSLLKEAGYKISNLNIKAAL